MIPRFGPGWLVAFLLWAGHADARLANAQFLGCTGCHGVNSGGVVAVTMEPGAPGPGDLVRLNVVVTGPEIQIGGFSVFDADGTGSFSPSAGAVSVANPQWAFHTVAQPVSNGEVRFAVDWQAPDSAGAANFVVSAIAGNGNSQNTGDYATQTEVQFTYGCDAVRYFFDGDRDGVGSSAFAVKVGCTMPEGFAAVDGDCNENSADVHPGAPEMCNNRDDDCDSEIDEEVVILPRYADLDADGFGDPDGAVIMDCIAPAGYANNDQDCDDADSTRYPGAAEVCDFIDNDCNSDVDDGAREFCGVGFCRRESESCFSACLPGTPFTEQCNGFDDDCDGQTDEAEACPEGQRCVDFACIEASSAEPEASSTPDPRMTSDFEPDPAATPETATTTASGAAAASPLPARSGCHATRSSARGTMSWGGYGWLLGALAVRRRKSRTLTPSP